MKKQPAKTVADFRAAHDPQIVIPTKIRAALAQLAKAGPEHWEYEGDLIKMAGIGNTTFAQYREQFADHMIEVPGGNGRSSNRRVYFGSAKVAAKIRGEM